MAGVMPVEEELPVRFVTRGEWGAQHPSKITERTTPIEHVCFSYNTGTAACHGDEDCKRVLQQAQKRFMENGLSDIPYNFLVGGDGTVYEGRGWHVHSSTAMDPRTQRGNRVDIAFIGEFDRETVPRQMYYNGIDWIYYAVRNKIIQKNYSFQENRYPLRLNYFRPKYNQSWQTQHKRG